MDTIWREIGSSSEVSLLRKGKSWIFPSNRTATNIDHFLKDNHQLNRTLLSSVGSWLRPRCPTIWGETGAYGVCNKDERLWRDCRATPPTLSFKKGNLCLKSIEVRYFLISWFFDSWSFWSSNENQQARKPSERALAQVQRESAGKEAQRESAGNKSSKRALARSPARERW